MRNITVKVNLNTYHEARIWAAQHDRTVSALFRSFLQSLHTLPSPRLSPAVSGISPVYSVRDLPCPYHRPTPPLPIFRVTK
jgi:hypothetical protein